MAENTDSPGPAETVSTASASQQDGAPSTKQASRRPAAKRSGATRTSAAKRASGASTTSARPKPQTRTAGTSRRESTQSGIGAVGSYAERAVLIPVGAALIARERLLGGVNDVISSYSTAKKTQAQLHRFERRGLSARDRVEHEARRTRVRFERELRRRKRELDRTAGKVQDRILNLV